MSAPYMLTIHLMSGKTVTLPCESFEIVQATDHHGERAGLTLNYTPVDGWERSLGYLNFAAVAAIEVERDPALAAIEASGNEG